MDEVCRRRFGVFDGAEFKFLGFEKSSNLGEKIGRILGPFFRSKKKIMHNLKQSNIGNSDNDRERIIKNMF